MIEHLETQAKNINDVLLAIQKNQTSNPLAIQQMEIIAALNRNNEKTALERRIRKEPKKTRHVGMLSGLKQNWQPQPTQHAAVQQTLHITAS
jgi:aspartate/methionine/tyrosine aminotransferase